jgi:hypothetical protein
MDWARILAYVTGMVDQELLGRISGRREPHHPPTPPGIDYSRHSCRALV